MFVSLVCQKENASSFNYKSNLRPFIESWRVSIIVIIWRKLIFIMDQLHVKAIKKNQLLSSSYVYLFYLDSELMFSAALGSFYTLKV